MSVLLFEKPCRLAVRASEAVRHTDFGHMLNSHQHLFIRPSGRQIAGLGTYGAAGRTNSRGVLGASAASLVDAGAPVGARAAKGQAEAAIKTSVGATGTSAVLLITTCLPT